MKEQNSAPSMANGQLMQMMREPHPLLPPSIDHSEENQQNKP